MKYDQFGQAHAQCDELCDILYENPNQNLRFFQVIDPENYNDSVKKFHLDYELLDKYLLPQISIEEFDSINQSHYKMPVEYKNLDIVSWILDQCTTQDELQRVGHELLLYQERNLFDLLRYLKYLVDLLRQNDIVWGVGRGSSVASYVLFLIGVHKINSIYYDLSVEEFLK